MRIVTRLGWLLVGRWLACPPLPRRITASFCSLLWQDGLYRGAVAASVAWIALILFALLARKYRP